MRIESLRLQNLRRFEDRVVNFGSGMNTIFGQNEQGKTTILAGILHLLFTDSTTRSQKILQDIKSWRTERLPVLRLTYEYDGEKFILERDFASKTQSLIDENGQVIASSASEISQIIYDHIGISNEEVFKLTALIAQNDIARIGLAKEKSVKDLQTGIQESLTGSGSVSVAEVVKDIDKELLRLEKGLHGLAKANGVIKQLQENKLELESKVSEIKLGLQTYSTSMKTETDSSKELETLSTEIEKLQALITHNEKRAKIEGRLAELEKLISEKTRIIKDIENLADRLDSQRKELKVVEGGVEIEDLRVRIAGAKAVIKDKEFAIEKAEKGIAEIGEVRQSVGGKSSLLQITVVLFPIVFAAFLSWIVGYPYIFIPIGLVLAIVVPRLILKLPTKDSRFETSEKESVLQELRYSVKEKEDEIVAILKEADVRSERELLELDVKIKTIKEQVRENEGALSALTKGKNLDEIKDEETGFLKEKKGLEIDLTDELKASFIDPRNVFTKKRELESLQFRKKTLEESNLRAKVEVEASKYSYDDLAVVEEKLARVNSELEYSEKRATTLRNVRGFILDAREDVISTSGEVISEYMEKYLPMLTDGKYSKAQVGEGLQIQIFSNEKDDWVDPMESLSRGAIDQVYLIARLAILSIVSKDSFPPIILDDPFVTFDAKRQKGVQKMLKDLSKDHQFVLLTCHKDFDSWGNLIKL